MKSIFIFFALALAANCCQAQIYYVQDMSTVQIDSLNRDSTVVLLPGRILEEHGLCQVLQLSRSAYYQWQEQQQRTVVGEKKAIARQVLSVFKEHRRRYGLRRVPAELKANTVKVGAYQVGKVLKEHGLKAIQPRSFVPKTTDSRHPYLISLNQLMEHPLPYRPNQVWVSDISYIPLADGS